MTIVEFAEDPQLLNLSLSPAQRTLLKSFYGEALTDAEAAIFRQCAERDYERREYSELTCIAGARSGKDSRIACSIALYETFYRDHSYLHAGERGFVVIIAQDQRGGQIAFNYLKAAIERSDFLSSHVREARKTEIELDNRITVAVYPCSYRAPRGITVVCGVADELAFWRDENYANPDREILRSIARGMANVPDAKLVKISTPYGKSGVLYDDFLRRHELSDTLVWRAPTRLMNPAISTQFLDRERQKDPVAFAREYEAEFSDDTSGFIQRAALEAAVIHGRFEIGPNPRLAYVGFVDLAGGSSSDSSVLAIAHPHKRNGETFFLLDLLKEIQPPFSPEHVTKEFSQDLKRYGLREITGDRFGSQWVKERFQQQGITYHDSELSRSEIYLEFLPLLNSRKLELLDNARLVQQLCSLQRKTGSSGRDIIDHSPGQHDDLANAAAGALVVAAVQPSAVECYGIF
jgi:hypothetical protein